MAGRPSAATERALERVRNGQNPHSAARAEGIEPSTIYRALKRQRGMLRVNQAIDDVRRATRPTRRE